MSLSNNLPPKIVLSPPPINIPLYNNGVMTLEWTRWFDTLYQRIGAASGDLIYSASTSAATTSAFEPALFGLLSNFESKLTGIVLQIVEQIQRENQDTLPSAEAPTPPQINVPDDIDLSYIIGLTIANSPVTSVFGRNGNIIAQTGDYNFNQISGTINLSTQVSNTLSIINGGTGATNFSINSLIVGNGTSSFTEIAPGVSGEVLTSNGTTWTSQSLPVVSIAPNYEEIVAILGQTIFNTTVQTLANSFGKSYLLVTLNGIIQREIANYSVTGANQITFITGLNDGDIVTIRSFL